MIVELVNEIVIQAPRVGFVVAMMAIVFVILESVFENSNRKSRISAIMNEYDRIRRRERANLFQGPQPHPLMRHLQLFAERAKLSLWLLDKKTQQNLLRAGLRSGSERTRFLVMRLLAMIACSVAFVLFCVTSDEWLWLLATPVAAWVGITISTLLLEKIGDKRDVAMTHSAPDIVDLLTICVESGMSIETSLQRVAEEMVHQDAIVAEELAITAAELAYVPKRSDAFENLMARTKAKPIIDLCIALIQADNFGTSIGATLRIQSAEARKFRQLEAERHALGISPKLSIVMVIFFLPALLILLIFPSIASIIWGGMLG